MQVGGVCTELFTIRGITRGFAVKKILDEFGLPYGSNLYEWESGGESFSFYYIDEENMTHLSFDIDPETGLLDCVCYSA